MDNPTKSDEVTADTSVKEVKNIILALEAIVEESHDAIIGKSLDGVIVSWNGGATKMFGYTKEEMIGKSLTDLFAPGNQEELEGLLTKIKAGETITDYDSIWVKKDGTSADVEFSISPIHAAEKGLIIGSSLIGRDITERRKLDKKTRETEKQFHDFFATSQDGVFITSEDGKVIDFNDNAMKMFGYEKREEMANFSITSIYEKPEDRTAFIALINKQGYVREIDFRFRRKDGTVLDTLVSVKLQQNDDGTGKKYFGTVRDVTEYKKALTEIGNSRSYLNNIINSIADPVFVKNDKHEFVLANDAVCKMLGTSRENIIGKTFAESLPKEQVDVFFQKDNLVLESGTENTNEELLTGSDGKILTIVTKKTRYIDDQGNKFLVAVIRDITERKEAELKSKIFSQALDSANDSVILTDLTGMITYANKEALRTLGYTKEEFTKLSVSKLTEKPEVSNIIREETVKKGFWSGEVASVKKSGEAFASSVHTSVIFDDKGSPVGTMGIFRDITEKKKAESALRQIEVAVENSLDAIISEKLDGTVQSWNAGATKLFGYTAEEMIGKSISLLLPSDKKNESSELLAKVAHGEAVLNHETIRISKGGTKINVSISIAPIKEGNTITSASLIERDITESNSKKAELNLLSKRVLELQSTKDEFVAIAAHQLRAPISTISGFAELFLGEGRDNLSDKQKESIETIQKSSSSMNELVNFLLKITRAESGRSELSLSPINLKETVETIIEILGSELNPKNQTVEVTQDPNPFPYVFLDKEMIKQVVMNLLSNASRYSPKNSTIKVQMMLEGINIKLSVIDSGIGIPKEAQGKIFDKFFRAENAKATQTDGTGLGLALAKSLVEVWGGQMSFESEENKGTTFHFTMPILGKKEAVKGMAI